MGIERTWTKKRLFSCTGSAVVEAQKVLIGWH